MDGQEDSTQTVARFARSIQASVRPRLASERLRIASISTEFRLPFDDALERAARRWGQRVRCNDGPGALGPEALAAGPTDERLRELGHREPKIESLREQRVVGCERD